ncbi:hypothetical protein FB451DRAFT_1373215 [Mycena latifolia]|nr:hypothetical protein FB451DRAFT_1373215 [Mycena latifolia]
MGFEKLSPDSEEMDDEVQGAGGTRIGFKRGQREGHVASSPSIAKEEGQQVRGRGRRGKSMNDIPWLSLAHPSFDWVLAIGLRMGRMAQWGIWGCAGVTQRVGHVGRGRRGGGKAIERMGTVKNAAAHQFHCPLIKATKWQVATITSLLAPDLHLHRHHSLLTPPRPPPLASDCVSDVDFDLASAPRGVVLTNVSSKYVVKSRKIQRGVPQLKSAGRPCLPPGRKFGRPDYLRKNGTAAPSRPECGVEAISCNSPAVTLLAIGRRREPKVRCVALKQCECISMAAKDIQSPTNHFDGARASGSCCVLLDRHRRASSHRQAVFEPSALCFAGGFDNNSVRLTVAKRIESRPSLGLSGIVGSPGATEKCANYEGGETLTRKSKTVMYGNMPDLWGQSIRHIRRAGIRLPAVHYAWQIGTHSGVDKSGVAEERAVVHGTHSGTFVVTAIE